VEVADQLEPYPQYARLRGQRLLAEVRDGQIEWLAHHWAEHRAS
jgi:hypothetical protein